MTLPKNTVPLERIPKKDIALLIGLDAGKPCAAAIGAFEPTPAITGLHTYPTILQCIAHLDTLAAHLPPQQVCVIVEAIYLDQTQFNANELYHGFIAAGRTANEAIKKVAQVSRSNGNAEEDALLLAEWAKMRGHRLIEIAPSKRTNVSQAARKRRKTRDNAWEFMGRLNAASKISFLNGLFCPTKVIHEHFVQLTKFSVKKQTNVHERDAAMLIWEFLKTPGNTIIF